MVACTKCKIEKTADAFDRFPRKRNGLNSQCRSCRREANRVRMFNSRDPLERERRKALEGYKAERVVWWSIINRCENPKCSKYKYYGGRGIRMCDRWRRSFSAFVEDMGKRPDGEHSIDRIDNDGHYEPGNCRWASSFEQARNKSSAVLLTAMGRTLCVAEWAEICGVSASTIRTRLSRGVSPEDALRRGRLKRRRCAYEGQRTRLEKLEAERCSSSK